MNDLVSHDATNIDAPDTVSGGSEAASQRIAEQLPDTVEACIQAADLLRQAATILKSQEKLEEADAVMAATVARFPDSDSAAARYAWAAVHLADWDAALARWDTLLERFPFYWAAMSGRGEALRELGRLDEADEALRDAMSRHPDNFMGFAQYAWVAPRRHDWDQALERWRAFQQRFPDLDYGAVGATEALMELGRLDDAETEVNEAKARFPDSAGLRNIRASLARRRQMPSTPLERVREKIRESNIEAKLPKLVQNPEVLIEITSICNFACTYCVSPMKLREKKQMSMETFRQVIEQVATITTRPVGLHVDGEPTSHPQFKEMALLANAHGLPVTLATNGSHLDPGFLEIWMDPLISMSTTPEELAKRHNKLNFESYISRIVEYAGAWARSTARQNVFFQIIHYPHKDPKQDAEYRRRKNDFLIEFCRRTGLYDTCVEETSINEDSYRLRRKGHPGILTFIKQELGMGGLYPADSKFIERERATVGFCDSPWRLLVVHSNGTLGACCNDLSGGTTFATAEEVEAKSIKELWESSPRIQRLRETFLNGTVDLDVCQRCLVQEQVALLDSHTG